MIEKQYLYRLSARMRSIQIKLLIIYRTLFHAHSDHLLDIRSSDSEDLSQDLLCFLKLLELAASLDRDPRSPSSLMWPFHERK